MKLKISEKASYACGDLGVNLMANFISSYFLLYMTDVLGITPLVGGLIFAVARIWDAINDPLMGSVSERTKPRKAGRYRFWMMVAVAPYVLFFILCFAIPNLNMSGKVVLTATAYIFYGMSSTMFQVPYGSLSSVMTTNTQEYAVLGAVRDYGANISGTIVGAVSVGLIMFFGGSMSNGRGYLMTALVMGGVSCLFLAIACLGTRERIQTTPDPVPLKDCMKAMKANRPSQILAGMIVFASLGVGFRIAWTAYYAMYYLNNPAMIGTILTIMFTMPLIGLIFVPFLTKVLTKKVLLIMGNSALAISGALFLAAKTNTTIVTIAAVFCGIAMCLTYSVIWGILPDTVNYGEWKTGIRATGFIYAMGVFALKIGSAIANMGAGSFLSFLGYDAAAEVQTASVQNGIYLANGWTSVILGILAIIFISFYNLDKSTMDRIESDLQQRRANQLKEVNEL